MIKKKKILNPPIKGFKCLEIFSSAIQSSFRSSRINSLKYLSSETMGCKDIGIRKSEFVTKTLLLRLFSWRLLKINLKTKAGYPES